MSQAAHSLDCPVQRTLEVIGGKWRTVILFYLTDGPKRYGELRRLIDGISEKMLIQSLRELESSGLVRRRVEQSVPPKVEYSLTERGKTVLPIIDAMRQWGQHTAQISS